MGPNHTNLVVYLVLAGLNHCSSYVTLLWLLKWAFWINDMTCRQCKLKTLHWLCSCKHTKRIFDHLSMIQGCTYHISLLKWKLCGQHFPTTFCKILTPHGISLYIRLILMVLLTARISRDGINNIKSSKSKFLSNLEGGCI